ncbi:MAG: hypothetical protein KC502_02285 [Myxococcales bacterium]|nr:hypothetical protein [Myxococcales bacterium]
MFGNRISKAYVSRRDLLRSTFPYGHQFLLDLEERSAPVVWLSTGKNAHVYWEDGFLLQIRFVGIGEANTGIRLSPGHTGNLVEGTENRCGLLFPEEIDELIQQHDGYLYRWASRVDDGSFELRHPAPGKFFRDLQARIERVPVRERAERLAATLAEEFKDEEPAQAAPSTAAPSLTTPPASGERPAIARPRASVRVKALRPSDTNRLLTFEHLVDAYFDWARADDEERKAELAHRLAAMESLFLCRLPRPGQMRGPKSSDRAQVIALAWRCVDLENSLRSPFVKPPRSPKTSMITELWEDHSLALGTPIEALRRSCRETFMSSLLCLFPGVEETIVAEVDVESAMS